jgi:hypothetical protein
MAMAMIVVVVIMVVVLAAPDAAVVAAHDAGACALLVVWKGRRSIDLIGHISI